MINLIVLMIAVFALPVVSRCTKTDTSDDFTRLRQEKCTTCHSSNLFINNDFTPEEFEATIERMPQRGCSCRAAKWTCYVMAGN